MKSDKKKLMVLGALALVLVAVGAFTFVGGGSPPPAPVAKTEPTPDDEAATGDEATGETEGTETKATDPGSQLVAQLSAGELPTRDPFQPDIVAKVEPPVTEPPAQASAPRQTPTVRRRPSGIGGSLPPFNPMGSGGGLPPIGGPGIGLEPGTALRSPDDPGYRVKGVIQGSKPMAVLEDGNGNQKLVPVGGSVDGDTQVTGIEKGKVRVRHRGKEKTLDLEEGSK